MKNISSYLKIFFISFISMMVVLIPNIADNNGVLFLFGDYTYQQIPFYYHAADTVQNLGIGWDWYTDLGSDFLTSYSYYLTGSIFFWMISWLSGLGIIYAMPFMIAFKTAVGALGAYIYIKRYVKNDHAAFIGAFMYAFSGFQMVSLVFNSFHDITALFPFLLTAFDMLVKENRKGIFAVTVGLVALTNYFFFAGIVVFVIIYYIIKCLKKDFEFSVKNFISIFIESLTGAGIAAVILIPTFLVLSSADRVGDVLYGVDLVSYSDNTIVPKIFQSLFIMPDPPSSAMLFLSKDNSNNWASISLYLPLFASTGVVSYCRYNKKSWLSLLLAVSLIIACVPGLNSIFSLFNSSYYARWFYMPVLLMCLATAKSLDQKYDLVSGIKVQAIATGIIIFISFLPDKVTDTKDSMYSVMGTDQIPSEKIKLFGMNRIPVIFWQCIGFAIIFILIVYVYNHEKDKDSMILKKISACMIVLVTTTYIIFISNTIEETRIEDEYSYNSYLDFSPELNDESVYRISHANLNSINTSSMLWRKMNAGCFHSVESNESDKFYYEVQGYKRLMNSQYKSEDYPAYGLLSIKYIFNLSTGDDLNVEIQRENLRGCSLYDKQDCYYIYKNDNYVPMGFMYDYCIDDSSLNKYLDDNINENRFQYKKLAMMRSLVLSDEDIEKYSGYIEVIPEDMLNGLDENTYFSDCQARAAKSCSSFEYSSKGFSAEITSDKPGLVYFSVPCSDGWTAKVNGKDAEIITAHYGLSAVAVESGESSIEFFYETPGLKTGMIITFVSLSFLIGYAALFFILKRKKV